jgi:Pyruvate/2-oxoacid:ferredoxin oxidoreductase delta subunit
MPAIPSEIDQAIEEGVRFEFLVSPIEIRRLDGRISEIVVQRMRLGEPDASGRRRPVPVGDALFSIPATSIIAAVSQHPGAGLLCDETNLRGWFETNESGQLSDGLFAGGDARGLGLASQAVGHGRRAAETAHAQLMGLPEKSIDLRPPAPVPNVGMYASSARLELETLSAPDRLMQPNVEVHSTISEAAFLDEAERCLSCGSCFGCRYCWMYCNASGITEHDDPRPGRYFAIDLTVCEGCGKCVEVCPCGFLQPL